MIDRQAWARSLVEQVETNRPEVVRLATLASLAVRIEPELLRSLRLSLPGLSAAVEADLWFSPLVRSRGVDGIVLMPEVASLLRRRLEGDLLQRAWILTERHHLQASSGLQLEEKIAWLSVSGRSGWREEGERELNSAVRAVLSEGRSGVARWALRALPQLPKEMRQTSAAWLLKLASERQTGRRIDLHVAPPGNLFETDLSAVISGLPEVELGVQWDGRDLLLGEVSGDGTFGILVPDMEPRLVEVRWEIWVQLGWSISPTSTANRPEGARLGVFGAVSC